MLGVRVRGRGRLRLRLTGLGSGLGLGLGLGPERGAGPGFGGAAVWYESSATMMPIESTALRAEPRLEAARVRL